MFGKTHAVNVSFTDNSHSAEPGFERKMTFAHDRYAFDGKLVTAMPALVERTTGESVGGIFTSGTADFSVPEEIFKKLDSLFFAVGENIFCHRSLLFFSLYILSKKYCQGCPEVVRKLLWQEIFLVLFPCFSKKRGVLK